MLQGILKGDFIFNSWSGHRKAPDKFENDLSEFGTFEVYQNFKDFLVDHEYLTEDEDGEVVNVEDVLSNKEIFDNYFESTSVKNGENDIEYSMINKPFIFGEANTHDNPMHFISLDNIKNESDLLTFINDVLRDLGEVTHYTGLKNKYEVVKVAMGENLDFVSSDNT